jgi:hypothetical protein
MGHGSTAIRMRRIAALTLVVALVFAVPAYGASSSAESTGTHKVTAPVNTPTAKHTRPGATKSEIPVGPDAQTEQFRQELIEKQRRLDEFNAQ